MHVVRVKEVWVVVAALKMGARCHNPSRATIVLRVMPKQTWAVRPTELESRSSITLVRWSANEESTMAWVGAARDVVRRGIFASWTHVTIGADTLCAVAACCDTMIATVHIAEHSSKVSKAGTAAAIPAPVLLTNALDAGRLHLVITAPLVS